MKNYSDIDLKFERHPVTGDVTKKIGVRAVMQSVRNIVMTSMKEWETMPGMGAGIYRLQGENTTPTIQVDVKNKIEDALSQYEERVELEDVLVSLTEDMHTLIIKVVYYIQNNPDPVGDTIMVARVN